MDFIRFITEQQMAPGSGSIWREELAHYDAFMNQIIDGRGRAVLVEGYGDIYWAIEEASFLRFTDRADQFYAEMHDLMEQFLKRQGISYDAEELREVVLYQRLRTPTAVPSTVLEQVFEYNLPEFFSLTALDAPIEIQRERQRLQVLEEDMRVDKAQFAKERLLWGRRGGKFERAVKWESLDPKPAPATSVSPAV